MERIQTAKQVQFLKFSLSLFLLLCSLPFTFLENPGQKWTRIEVAEEDEVDDDDCGESVHCLVPETN